MTTEAYLIVTNSPSKGDLGGVVVYKNKIPVKVAVHQRFLNERGKLGIKRAIDGDLDGIDIDFKKPLTAQVGAFNTVFSKFCKLMNFDTILPYDELHMV